MANTGDTSSELWQRHLSDHASLHGRLLFRVAFRILRDASAAEDVVQQAFLKAWEHRQEIRAHDALRAWLVRSVVNGGLATARRRKSEARALRFRPEEDDNDGGLQAIERRELRGALLTALDDLPERTRVVVVLRIMEGMSGNEVKELLGYSAAEISRQLHGGLQTLRKALVGVVDEFKGA